MLYTIATPIGNLEDITYRAVRILHEVDFIICEDTRHSKRLLDHYGIQKVLTSFHAHSTATTIQHITDKLQQGQHAAYITDAGTPGISDPGYQLLQGCIALDITITPLPGPAAFLTALMASGLPINHFRYLGFLPQKKGRQRLLTSLLTETDTVVFYESPHRIEATLAECMEYLGPSRDIVIGRELTKIHEEFFRGTIEEACQHFTPPIKGEFVIIIKGHSPTKEKRQKYPSKES